MPSNLRRYIASGLLASALVLGGAGFPAAQADDLDRFSTTLLESKHEKERIAAAVSLGRLRDKRGIKPLVSSLTDRSRTVRAIAATALGHIGDASALPALRRAAEDSDKTVAKRAIASIARINTASAATPAPSAQPMRSTRDDTLARYQIAANESPRLSRKKPALYLVVKSAADDTKSKLSSASRKKRASQVKKLVLNELADTSNVTLDVAKANELGLAAYSIDVAILKLDRAERGGWVEIECELRIAISDKRGKMLSFLTGGAKVQVPKATFRAEYEAMHQTEALENAVKSVYQDMLKYLATQAG